MFVKIRYRGISTFLFFMMMLSKTSFCQIPDFTQVPTLYPGDSANICRLINTGVKISKNDIVAWFPKDSLSKKQMNKITEEIDKGVRSAEKLIKAPLSWQAHQSKTPYVFYFRLDSFVSHASGAGFVSIPFWRIKQDKAPWLHEAIHEMLNTTRGDWSSDTIPELKWAADMPLWLMEGLPDYIAIQASQIASLPLYDVFASSYNINVDSVCKENLKGPRGTYIVAFIGKKGVMPELFNNERRSYAPTFYHCSCSFVKYIAGLYSLDILLAGISEFYQEHEVLEKLTGQSIDNLKRDWLLKIGGN